MAREGDVVGVVLLRGVTVRGLSCLMGVPPPLPLSLMPSSALIFLGVLGEEEEEEAEVVEEEEEGAGERGASFFTTMGAGEVEEELEGKLGFVGV
jgi:hypothetical protein